MKIKRFVIVITSLIFSLTAYTKEIPLTDAQKVAKNWKQQLTTNKSLVQEISDSRTISESNINLYYIITFKTGGFVIVAADDNVAPILAYSDNDDAPSVIDNPSVKYWMENYQKQILYIKQNNLINTSVAGDWFKLSNNISAEAASKSAGPLLSTTWNQGCYYNALCPADAASPSGYCSHVPAGCVALAMAQIMKYYNYPTKGTSSHSYYDTNYGTQTANFSATTYSWTNMPNNLTAANSSVATLIYHCGVAVDMQYAADGSGAFSTDVPAALKSYFNYPNAIYNLRSNYTDTLWSTLLRNEIDAQRPVYYSGDDLNVNAGHAFVCDGYQGKYFHFNWGWGGAYNGYFLFNNLNPSTYTFNANQEAVTNFVPPNLKPVANFGSNLTTIFEGNSVTFSDKSSNNPTKWAWSFTGGTPSTSNLQNPTITYNTAGTFSVTLTASNDYGANTITLNNFITVLQHGSASCDTLAYPLNGSFAIYQTNQGYATGTNEYSMYQFAQYFTQLSANSILTGAFIYFGAAAGNNTHKVTVAVWNNTGTSGAPGTIIASKDVSIGVLKSNITNKLPTYINFDVPFSPATPYYLGVILPQTAGDTAAIVTNHNGEASTVNAWVNYGSWGNFTDIWQNQLNVDLAIFPYVCLLNQALSVSLPKDTTICEGNSLNITATAKGGTTPYTYKWNNGLTSQTITVKPLVTATYTVTVTDSKSATAINKIIVSPASSALILTQPYSKTKCSGDTASFKVIVTGRSLTYNWQVNKNDGLFVNIANSNSATYYTAATNATMNNYVYRCLITGKCTALTSNSATLTVNSPPLITTDIKNITICSGKVLAFNITATGTTLKYQWQSSPIGSIIFADIDNANGSSIDLGLAAPSMNLNKYRCIISGLCSSPITSSIATVSIIADCSACDTLGYPLNGTYSIYQTTEGYATGTNEYSMYQFAQYFTSLPVNSILTGAFVYFGYAAGNDTHKVTIAVWDNTGSGGSPGASPIAQKDVTIADIKYCVANHYLTQVNFEVPIEVKTPYFVGVILPQTAGDTAVIVSNATGDANTVNAWVDYLGWGNFLDVWQGYLNVDLAIFPYVCSKCSSFKADIVANGLTSFCSGSSVELKANTTSGIIYQWKKDNIAIPGATNSNFVASVKGMYSVYETNASSCTATSNSIEVNVYQKPTVNLGNDMELQYNDSITLNAGSGFISYLWNDGSTNQTLQIKGSKTAPGSFTFTVDVVDNNGCKGAGSINIIILPQTYTFRGTITYDNDIKTPLDKIKVILFTSQWAKKDSAFSDAKGLFTFTNLTNGSYHLSYVTDKPLGGVNPGDALFCNRFYIGLAKFSDLLREKAADVNGDNTVSPGDALFINRRYINYISSFATTDWLFEPIDFIINAADCSLSIKALCRGDVDGSNSFKKKK